MLLWMLDSNQGGFVLTSSYALVRTQVPHSSSAPFKVRLDTTETKPSFLRGGVVLVFALFLFSLSFFPVFSSLVSLTFSYQLTSNSLAPVHIQLNCIHTHIHKHARAHTHTHSSHRNAQQQCYLQKIIPIPTIIFYLGLLSASHFFCTCLYCFGLSTLMPPNILILA